MKRHIVILGFALLYATVVFAQEERPPKEISYSVGGERRFVTAPSRMNLSGEFRRNGVVLNFVSRFEGSQYVFDLMTEKRQSILRVEVYPEFYEVALFGGDTKVRRARIDVREPADFLKIDEEEDVSEAHLKELITRPEYRILPNLAIELAHLGIGGADAPAAAFVHGLGVASATAQGLEMPPLFEQLRPEIELTQRGASSCKDLLSDPCKNECYGMCGAGRTCWYLVCGNCCGYEGCYTHDWVCRCKGMLRFGCVTFTAFFKAKRPCEAVRDCRPLQCK